MSWLHSSSTSTADELRSGNFRAVFQVFIDGSWKRPSECGRTVSSGGVNYIVGRPDLFYRVVVHNDHPSLYYKFDVRPDGQEHFVRLSYVVSPGSSLTVSSWRMDPARAARNEAEPGHAFKFGDIPEAPHGPAGAKSAPGTSGGAESPGNLGKVLVTASECERFTIAPHTITFAGGSSASSSAAPGVGVKKAQTKFGIHTAAPKPIGYAAPHSEMRDFDFRTIRELPQLVFEYRDEVALCIAGILKSVPGAQLSGAKRSAAAAGLRADVKPNIKPDLASLKAQAAAARAARTGAGSLQGGDEDDDDEEEEDDDSDEEGCSGGRGGRAAGGAARRGGAAASQSVAVVSLLHDEEASAGKGGRRKRGKGGTAAAAAAAAALPTFEETRIVRVVAAGGVSKGIREVLIPVLPAGTGLGYSEGADGALCLDDDDDAGAAAGAGAGRSRSRNAKAGKAAAAGDAGAVCPMPWYGLPHLLAAAQAALASEDSHSSRLRALDAAKALAEASLRGPASSSSSSSSSSAGVSAGGPAGRVWTHSGAVVTSIAQALSQGSGLPLVVAFGPSPAFKPMQDIHIAV